MRTRDRTTTLVLTIRDVVDTDLPGLAWSGSPGHVRHIGHQLERVRAGGEEYLGVFLPSGNSVGKGGISYERSPAYGFMHEFTVRGDLQSCGIGTALIAECERRIRARGLWSAEISVEEGNPRARALYERLGYVAYDCEPAAWDQDLPDGSVQRYETTCTLLRKELH